MNIRSVLLTSLLSLAVVAVAAPQANAETTKVTKKSSKSKKATSKKFKYLTPVNASASKPAGAGKRMTTKSLKKSSAQADEKLSRDIVFDGSTVNGKYHSAGEAVAKVEQEKKLNDLIGMRRDFKDRLAAEKERLNANRSVTQDEDGAQSAN